MADAALWGLFAAAVVPLLVLDIAVLSRRPHAIAPREALLWTGVWVTLALLFGAAVWHYRGSGSAAEYLTGYVIEQSLSVDNVFLFIVIFSAFHIPTEHQHRVLFWGIVLAVLMRAAMVCAGALLIARFHPIIYVFGALLIYTGIRMFVQRDHEADPSSNGLVHWLKRRLRVTDRFDGSRFVTRVGGARRATPLLLTLVVVAFTDLVFAVDSIPAVFAVTSDPFIVLTSNVFAVMGLRSLFSLLAAALTNLRYLKPGLSAVLVFVGGKMVLPIKMSPFLPLAAVLGILAVAVGASLIAARRERRAPGGSAEGLDRAV